MTTTRPAVPTPLPDLEFFTADDVLHQVDDPRLLQRALNRGEAVKLCRGVYARERPEGEEERHLQVLRACLAHPVPDGVVGGISAALLHGLELGPRTLPTGVTLLRPGAGASTAEYEVLATRLPASHTCRVDGVPVSTVARTVVDITRREPFGSLTGLVVADSALRKSGDPAGLRDEIETVLSDLRGCGGLSRTRSVMRSATPHAAGATETISRALLHRMEIPTPLLDVTYRWDPDPDAQGDLTAPDASDSHDDPYDDPYDGRADPYDYCARRWGSVPDRWRPYRTAEAEPDREGSAAVVVPFSWPDVRVLGIVLDRPAEDRGVPSGWPGDRAAWLAGPRRFLRSVGWCVVEWSAEDLFDPWPLSQRLTTIMREISGGPTSLDWSALGRSTRSRLRPAAEWWAEEPGPDQWY